jgi:hypothetical protein
MNCSRSFLSLLLVFLATPSLLTSCDNDPLDTLVVATAAPYSADPLEFDFFTHHIIFGSIFGTLVTEGKVGGIHGFEVRPRGWMV